MQEGTELQQIQAIDAGIIDKGTFCEGFWSCKPTWIFQQFINRPEKIIGYFTGNQKGKTCDVAYSYVLRIMGMHPVEKKNMRPDNPIRTYRFGSMNPPRRNFTKNSYQDYWLPMETSFIHLLLLNLWASSLTRYLNVLPCISGL